LLLFASVAPTRLGAVHRRSRGLEPTDAGQNIFFCPC
jgi:hypothetical protein